MTFLYEKTRYVPVGHCRQNTTIAFYNFCQLHRCSKCVLFSWFIENEGKVYTRHDLEIKSGVFMPLMEEHDLC